MNGITPLLPGKVARNREVAPGYFLMELVLPAGFATPVPGQFVLVRIKGLIDPLLGRPLSIYTFARTGESAVIELLYHVVGKGTHRLSLLVKDDELQVMGPLGTPFAAWETKETVILVAGGIGVAPLAFLASHIRESLPGRNARIMCYLGAPCSGAIVGLERLELFCSGIMICTDDGSRGRQCLVTELLIDDIGRYNPKDSIIYACGPLPMIGRLAEILQDKSLPCQVSMEERMACGLGACLGCAIAVNDPDGRTHYERVCKEGPVFDIRAITRRH